MCFEMPAQLDLFMSYVLLIEVEDKAPEKQTGTDGGWGGGGVVSGV